MSFVFQEGVSMDFLFLRIVVTRIVTMMDRDLGFMATCFDTITEKLDFFSVNRPYEGKCGGKLYTAGSSAIGGLMHF